MVSRCLFFGLVLTLAAVSGASLAAEPEKTVQVVLDFGDGSEKRYTQIPWKEEANAFSVTAAAGKHPRGFALQSRGSGATRFVFSLDGQKNEGNGRNWILRINDKLAKQSCELVEVSPDDVILWRFQRYE